MDIPRDKPSRERVWLDAWIAVATSSNSTRSSAATGWADVCLVEFDKRFPEPKDEDRRP